MRLAFLESLRYRESSEGGHVFLDSNLFPVVGQIESQWEMLRREFQQIRTEELSAYPELNLHDGGWDVYPFIFFGKTVSPHLKRCPETAKLITAIPGIFMASFSILRAGKKVLPHCGRISRNIIRCHVGLDIPAGDCVFKVNDEERRWEQGKTLVFHDWQRHEAWNRTEHDRVVFIFDIPVPGTTIFHVSMSPDTEKLMAKYEGERLVPIRSVATKSPWPVFMRRIFAFLHNARTQLFFLWNRLRSRTTPT